MIANNKCYELSDKHLESCLGKRVRAKVWSLYHSLDRQVVEGELIRSSVNIGYSIRTDISDIESIDYFFYIDKFGNLCEIDWIMLLDEEFEEPKQEPKQEPKPKKVEPSKKLQTVYSDCTYHHGDDTITLDCLTKTRQEWLDYRNLINRVLRRKID